MWTVSSTLRSLHALLDTFPLCVVVQLLPAHTELIRRQMPGWLELNSFLCLIEYVKKEKWQFVIKCETYCGAWFPCMHQRVKVYPGLGQSSKFIQCSTSLASQPSSQQYMQRTQHRAHRSLYNAWLGMSYEAFHHSSSPFHYSIHHCIPPNVDTPDRQRDTVKDAVQATTCWKLHTVGNTYCPESFNFRTSLFTCKGWSKLGRQLTSGCRPDG